MNETRLLQAVLSSAGGLVGGVAGSDAAYRWFCGPMGPCGTAYSWAAQFGAVAGVLGGTGSALLLWRSAVSGWLKVLAASGIGTAAATATVLILFR